MAEDSKEFDARRSERVVVVLVSILGAALLLWMVVIGIIGLRP